MRHERHRYVTGMDPADQWHEYEIEWTPMGVKWFVDGAIVRGTNDQDEISDYFDKEHVLMMNLWTPLQEAWAEGFSDKDMPW